MADFGEHTTAGGTIERATLRRATGLDTRAWTVLLLATIGTNLLDFASAPPPGVPRDGSFLAAIAVRVIVVFWASYALQRRVLDVPRPYLVTWGLARFVALQIALLVPVALAARAAAALTGTDASPVAQWLATFIMLALVGLVLIRLLAWNAALARGERFGALPAIWHGQKGASGRLAQAFAVLVLPAAAVHLAMTMGALRMPHGLARLAIVLADGGVQAWQLLATLALSAIALDVATGRSVVAEAAWR